MDFTKYYEAREKIIEIMGKDLLGPLAENEVIFGDRPLEYYVVGKLYPIDSETADMFQSSAEDCGELDSEAGVSLSNSKNPSSFGISFSLNNNNGTIIIQSSAAKYKLISREDAQRILEFGDDEFKSEKRFWQRHPLVFEPIYINVSELTIGKAKPIILEDNLIISVILHKCYPDGSCTITVSMINKNQSVDDYETQSLLSYFQPQLSIRSENSEFVDVRRNAHISTNSEIKELNMLYSKNKEYASGHGCAVNWELENDRVAELTSQFLPTFEIKQMKPSARFVHDVLKMKFLAEAQDEQIIDGLNDLADAYEIWINGIKAEIGNLPEGYRDAAFVNVHKCEAALSMIRESVKSLENKNVMKAFKLANLAMFTQRKQGLTITRKYTSDDDIKWYTFQLAFFVQEIISFSDPESEHRKKVDLLWFPTGGGKTEAYLGIAAFAIFFRRLTNPIGDGVTVLMRYTLRLLSFQQFERASALICACEIIRKTHNIPGGEIGIGLWAGQALTPNSIEKADKILRGEEDDNPEDSNPAQIEKCPWCGKPITTENYHCDFDRKRMVISCSDSNCPFHKGLPVYLIDEEIYAHTPTFIVSTVDKFAQITLNRETSALFGLNKNYLPPELIIQDELHLISGPLGTITGVYEAAIRKLCENNGVYPKVVASTATIRNAKEQIKALYASDYTQFPPQGIDINDSFFAEISTKAEKPARLYFGCMAIGTSPTTMMIRVMTSFLYAARYLAELGYDERIIDSFWTITGYFNTLRELGGAIVRVFDDIQDRFNYLRDTKFKALYPLVKAKKRFVNLKELTSREKSKDIGKAIQDLKIPYKKDGSTDPFDFLLSSNMISVGVDVGRLGSMVVVGQPKTTSEYIQATSRVGRETPGLVVTTYNQAKSRDRSHYEDFTQYHASFYKYVEATSVTPFSDRARDRTMQALYITLCRNLIDALSNENSAVNFRRNMEELKEIREYILQYVDLVDPTEHNNVLADIDEIEYEWEQKADRRDKPLRYKKTKYSRQDEALFEPDYCEDSRFRILNTMRSVETSITVMTNEGKGDD